MKPETVIGMTFFLLGLVSGIGLLLVKIDEDSLDISSKITPWVKLYRFRLFRILIACVCLVFFAGLGLALTLGWIKF